MSGPSGRPTLVPYSRVDIGLGASLLVAVEAAGDGPVLGGAAAGGGVAWREASIVDAVDCYTAMYVDGSHGSLDGK